MAKLKNYHTPLSESQWNHLCNTGLVVPERLMLAGVDLSAGSLVRGICLVNRADFADDLGRDHFRIAGRIFIVEVPASALSPRPSLNCCDYRPEHFDPRLQAWVYTSSITLVTSRYREYELREVTRPPTQLYSIPVTVPDQPLDLYPDHLA